MARVFPLLIVIKANCIAVACLFSFAAFAQQLSKGNTLSGSSQPIRSSVSARHRGASCNDSSAKRRDSDQRSGLTDEVSAGEDAKQPTFYPPPRAIEVQVVGAKARRADRTADSVTTNRETLQKSSSATMLEALSLQAADVYVTSRGAGIHGVAAGATGGIHIRGLGGSPNSQVVVVEDGVPDYQAIFGHPIADAYHPFLLEDATVVKGGDSVLYGTNAMGGAIVLRSRWLRHDGWQLASDSSFGSYHTLRQSLGMLAKQGRFDVAGGLLAFRSDGHRPGAGGAITIAQAAVRTDLGAGWTVTVRNKTMHLVGSDPGPVTHPHANHTFDVWRERVMALAQWTGSHATVTATPHFNVGRHVLYDGFLSTDITTGMQLQSEFQLHDRLTWLWGSTIEVAAADAKNRASKQEFETKTQRSASVYSQITLEPIRKLFIVTGGRFVVNPTFDSVLLYKAGVRYHLGRGWFVRSRLARNYRQPTLHELYLPFPTSNPDLKAERSTSVDSGFGYGSDRFGLSVSGYRNAVHNMIRYFGSWPHADVINIDQTTVWGVELSTALRDLGAFSLRASGNWQDVGRYTKQNPSARIVAALDFQKDVGVWKLNAELEGQWVHGIYMGNYSEDRIDDPYVLNLSLSAQHELDVKKITLEPYLILRNLLDNTYAFVENYPMPGFHLTGGLLVTM